MKHQVLKNLSQFREFHVLDFFLYSGSLEEVSRLKTNKIILRSSYALEDGEKQSYAGIFRSAIVNRDDISEIQVTIDSLIEDAQEKIHRMDGDFSGYSLMVQEFQEVAFGGVAFLEGDKIYIEISRKGSSGVVEGEVDQTIFHQNKVSIDTGEGILIGEKRDELSRLLQKLQIIYDFSLDIEFGVSDEGKIFIFQVRPITKSIFSEFHILDNSNIGENFPGKVSPLTYSFVKKLYADVYRSTAYHSGISYKKMAKISHIFDDLVAYKEGKIYYNISNWYKMLLLFPGDHKKAFDAMIGSSGNIRYLIIDDIISCLPTFFFKLKYFFLVLKKIGTFRKNLLQLEKYLEDFYMKFSTYNLGEYSLEGLQQMLMRFMQDLSYLWYVTIDNDFLIMKFQTGKNLQEINGLHSTNQVLALKKLANKEIRLEEYIKIYGERFGDELKLEKKEFDYEGKEFQEILKKYKNIEVPQPGEKKGFISFLINNREKFRIFRGKNFSIARKILLEIASRLQERGIIAHRDDLFSYTLEEISTLISRESRILSKTHQKVLLGNEFEGIVYIMDTFHIPKVPYDIILAQSFDPGWTVFLGGLKGIIIENGNLLSHISIMARELKLPLLMGARGSIGKIQNGDRIKVTKEGIIYKFCNNHYESI